MTLDREHEACRLPEEVQSLEELREPLCHRASLETALNAVRREMREVANRRTQRERDIKAALPADVTYRYNGYRVTQRSSDNALDFRMEESHD